jgi:hypothetical protein
LVIFLFIDQPDRKRSPLPKVLGTKEYFVFKYEHLTVRCGNTKKVAFDIVI